MMSNAPFFMILMVGEEGIKYGVSALSFVRALLGGW